MTRGAQGPARALAAGAIATVLFVDVALADPRARRTPSPSPPATEAAGPPRIEVAVDSLLDRRTTADFPHSSLTLTLSLRGQDASAVKSARPRVARAVDDTGRSVAATSVVRAADGWQDARRDGTPSFALDLGSSSRQARSLTAVEGVLEIYLPSRDPASTVRIERILSKTDRTLAVAALASRKIQLRVLSKAGLQREKDEAGAKKARAAKKKSESKKEGMEAMADAVAGMLAGTIETLVSGVGENDLILKVEDPGQKIFSFELATPEGTPVRSYATTNLEGYRIIRMFEPVPPTATLQVRLKTANSFAEVPFALADVKLP